MTKTISLGLSLYLILLAGFLAPAAAQPDLTQAPAPHAPLVNVDPLKEAKLAVVRLGDGEQIGSGFIISDEGHVLTALHVIQQLFGDAIPYVVNIYLHPDFGLGPQQALVVNYDEGFDLALLRIVDFPKVNYVDGSGRSRQPTVRPMHEQGQVSGEVVLLGNPLRCQQTVDCFTDRKLPLETEKGTGGFLVLAGNIGDGFSGGPALNQRSEAIGLIRGNVDEGVRIVPLKYVRTFLWRSGIDVFGEYRNYPSEISLLRKQYDEMKSAVESLKKQLVWENALTKDVEVKIDDHFTKKEAISIRWRKLFDDQHTPIRLEDVCLTVTPTKKWSTENDDMINQMPDLRTVSGREGALNECTWWFSVRASSYTSRQLLGMDEDPTGSVQSSVDEVVAGEFYIIDFSEQINDVAENLRRFGMAFEESDIASLSLSFLPATSGATVSLPHQTITFPWSAR
jgi:hypothetical protein